ncbi:MAG TPA: tetratricopeptide repeat protein [Ktedonobacterales bacterium]
MRASDSILTHSSDGLYASVYLRSDYPRPAVVQWLRKQILGKGAAVWAYIISILPNLWALVTHPAAFTWKGFDHLALGLLHIILPSFLLNSAYVVPAIVFLVAAVIAYFVARRDQAREDRALASQRAQDAADQREAARAAQQEEIKRVIERQLGQRWYGGSSVVDALPDQAVEAQPDDLSLLPPPTATLRGREADIQWLLDRLYPKPARVIALYGKSGMGKSSVVAAALAKARDRFPDGIAIVDCSSSKRAVTLLALALARFAPVGVAAADEAGLPAVARRVLRGNRVLIVLDNVPADLRGLEHLIEPLRDADLTVLAVAREELVETLFPLGAYHWLEPLGPADAQATLVAALSGQPAQRDVAAIASLRGGAPLTLALIGQYARATGRPLEEITRELSAPDRRVAAPSPAPSGPISVERVIGYLYERLPRPAQRLYLALAAHPTMALSESLAYGFARQVLRAEAGAALAALVGWGLLTVGEQAGVRNLYAPTPVRDDAQGRFRLLDNRTQASAMARVERFFITNKAYEADVPQSPSQQGYLRMIRRASALGADARLVALCTAAAADWRDKGRTEALLVYLPLGLRAVDRGRASRLPWVWLRYHLRAMRLDYYHMLYYYADALRAAGKTQYARVVYLRSLAIARYQHDLVDQADVYGGLAVVASDEAGQLDDLEAIEAARQRSTEDYKRVINLLTPLVPRAKDKKVIIVRDIANAYAGLARNALADDGENAETEALSLYQKGLAASAETAREYPGDFNDILTLIYSDLGVLTLQSADGDTSKVDLAARYYQTALDHISVSGNHALWLDTTHRLYNLELLRGSTAAAEARLRESVKRSHELGEALSEGLSRFNLGMFLLDEGGFTEASDELEQAGKLLSRAGDRETAALAMLNFGSTLLAQGKTTDADRAYRQSLVIFREATIKWGVSIAFMRMGEISILRGAMNDAEDLFTEARRIAIAGHDRHSESYILIDLGRAAQYRAHFDLARGYFQEAQDIFEGFGPPLGRAIALLGLAYIARLRGQYAIAEGFLKLAEAIAADVHSNSLQTDVEFQRGEMAYVRGELAQAERFLRASGAAYHAQGNPIGQSRADIDLALLALDRGQARAARVALEAAADLFKRMDAFVDEARALLQQGRAALAQGKLVGERGALSLLDTAYDRLCDMDDQVGQGQAQTWLGRLAFTRGEWDAAARHLDTALKLCGETEDAPADMPGLALARVFRAELAQARGVGDAAGDARAALRLAQAAQYAQGEGLAQSALASILTDMGDLDAATAAIGEALERLAQTEARPTHAFALSRQARILAARGDAAGARAAYDAALVEARSVEDAYALARVTRDAGAWLATQQPGSPEATALLQQSADLASQCGFQLAEAPATRATAAHDGTVAVRD